MIFNYAASTRLFYSALPLGRGTEMVNTLCGLKPGLDEVCAQKVLYFPSYLRTKPKIKPRRAYVGKPT